MNAAQIFWPMLIGITISVIGQIFVDWFRKRNASVSQEDFDRLEKKVDYLLRWKAAVTGKPNGDS